MTLSRPLVLFGAGNLGRRVARVLKPEMFCDNNRAVWGTVCEGIPIESPAIALERYPNATFVITIWHPSRKEGMLARIQQLKSMGASNIVPFCALFAEYGDVLLPHGFWERPSYYSKHDDEIRRARELFDAEGRAEFDRQIRLRLGDVSGQVIDLGVQYFPPFGLSHNEVFIDCGAYDGDTILQFRLATGDQFGRIVAFEPDPVNFSALTSALKGDRRITLLPVGTGARHETVRFTVDGTSSKISRDGTCEVQIVPLDEPLNGVVPTLMKFDIEGSEIDTLEGGRETISRHRPKMAVCLYHCPDHLWSIPLCLNELLPNSSFTMRTYYADGYECVCYCKPS